MDDLLPELQSVFRRVFDEDDLILTESTSAADVSGWDSMAHINLVVAVEKKFGVRFTAAELASLATGKVPAAVATVLGGPHLGRRLFLHGDGQIRGTLKSPLSQRVSAAARAALAEGKSTRMVIALSLIHI